MELVPSPILRRFRKALPALLGFLAFAGVITSAAAATSQVPLYLTKSAKPLMMLTMSRDEQLFKKAYTDYTDLDGDNLLDTTYSDTFDYSGYFDSGLCYSYSSGRFKAEASATDLNGNTKSHECGSGTGRWSGNFLNWVAMSRIDLLRFVLYGGNRQTDTATETVLERAHIPDDLHAWVKVYSGSDIGNYTPFAGAQSFCNASFSVNDSPRIRRAPGAWPEWAATALRQCGWSGSSDTPAQPATDSEFIARVKVCDPAATAPRESFCKVYGASYKPTGLLQEYGEPTDIVNDKEGRIRFGLLSGSFSNPRSGGILRRNIGLLTNNAGNAAATAGCGAGDEIDLSNGTFCNQGDGVEGVINAIRRLQLTQWNGNWSDCNTYGIHNRLGGNGQLNNPGGSTSADRKCSAWGNPLSEIYAETLRYITNEGKTDSFSSGTDLANLPAPAWLDPFRTTSGGNPYCASCSLLVLSSGLSSFDSDEVPNVLTHSASAATKEVGDLEGISGQYLAGRIVADQSELNVGYFVNTHEDLCKARSVSNLALVRGLCPDIPSQEGSYLMAGLAFKARTQDLRSTLIKPSDKKVYAHTYTVALSENLPKFDIPVGGSKISFAPLCQANNSGGAITTDSGWRSCYLGSVTIGAKTSSVAPNFVYGRPLEPDSSAGSFSLVWEDSQWGNDHDNDVVTMITYCVGARCSAQALGVAREGTGLDYGASYDGHDICWRSDSTVCGTDGKPFVASDEVLVRIENVSAYAGNAMLTGYSITGSNDDDVKRVALRPGSADGSVLTATRNPPASWARPHVLKYRVGSSGVKSLENPLWYAAKYGGFETLDQGKNPAPTPFNQGQDSWDKDNNGIPDAFFKVNDPARLKSSLQTVFDSVVNRSSSAAAIATNSTRLDTDTLIFQARFNSGDWSGQLIAYALDSKGKVASTRWDTNASSPFPSSAVRKIFTLSDKAAAGTWLPAEFEWANLSVAQQAALVSTDHVGWLRGVQDKEVTATPSPARIFRKRTHLLGDIINSDPYFVGATNFGYEALALLTPGQSSYAAFRAATATRTKALYVGANDGMLHAFNAITGTELFAYVPKTVYGNLASLASPAYSHRYLVDGAPNVGDAYWGTDLVLENNWHTVLVGTTGAGGSGVFALDVTKPDTFGASNVLWEINASTTGFADLGKTIGYATVGRLKSGEWVAIFGNGYESASGKAVLYIVDIKTGAKLKEIQTCPSSCPAGNGLSTPALLIDSNRTIIAAYAGDLKGNLWEFDLNVAAISSAGVAYKSGTTPKPLFAAGVNQPITAPVEIGVHPSGGYLIYFGTGKYYETGDNVVGASPPLQRFYAVWDKDGGTNTYIGALSDLVQQTVIYENTSTVTDTKGTVATTDDVVNTFNLRGVSNNTVDWGSMRGWYLDLKPPTGGEKGERVVSSPRLRNGRVIFPTLIPSAAPCDPGGTSWLMELDALTGGRVSTAVFDLDNNGLFNAGDYIQISPGVWIPASGIQSSEGIIKTPAIVSAGEVEYKFAGGSAGGLVTVVESGDPRAGRQSWRQLR